MKKLIIYLCVTGLIAWPIWNIYIDARNQIYFVYLDPGCNPVTNAKLKITEVKRHVPWYLLWAGMAGTFQSEWYHHEVTTGNNGVFSITKKGNSSLKVYREKDWEFGNGGENYLRSFSNHDNQDEIYLMTLSSIENPIAIYSQSHRPAEAIRYQNKQQTIAPYNYGGRKNSSHSISIGGDGSNVVAKIYATETDDRFDFEIYAGKGGGLIAVKKENLPFNDQIPQQGWQDKLEFSIAKPLPWPQVQQHYFYFKSFKGKGYGTLTLEHSFPERQVITNFFIDGVLPAYRGSSIQNPILFQENCGGHLARHYDGYYGHIILSEHDKNELQSPVSDERRKQSVEIITSREEMSAIARNINTSLSWYQQHAAFSEQSTKFKDRNKAEAGFLAIEALNNNGPIIERIEWLYQSYQPHAEKQLKDNLRNLTNFSALAVMARIAEDPRTSATVLREIHQLPDTDRGTINRALAKNPELPGDVADNIAQAYLAKSLAAKRKPHIERRDIDNRLQYYIWRNKSIGTKTFNKVIQSTPYLGWGFYLILRDERASFSSLKMLVNLDSPAVTAKDKKIWKRIQQKPEMTPYYRHFPLEPVNNRFTPPDQLEQLYYSDPRSHNNLGRNSATPMAILEFLCERKTKRLYEALVQNPNTPSECLNEAYYSELLSQRRLKDLANNPATPPELLTHLVDHVQSDIITLRVAANPSAPLELLERLSQGNVIVTEGYLRQSDVDRSLYCNPSTPDTIKFQLTYYMNINCE